MASKKKNKKVIVSAAVVIFVSIIGVNLVNTVVKHNSKLKHNAQLLALSCSVFSIDNSRYPSNLNELVRNGSIQLSSNEINNFSYQLNSTKDDETITVELWLSDSYVTTCNDALRKSDQ